MANTPAPTEDKDYPPLPSGPRTPAAIGTTPIPRPTGTQNPGDPTPRVGTTRSGRVLPLYLFPYPGTFQREWDIHRPWPQPLCLFPVEPCLRWWIQSIDSNPYTVFEILWPQQMLHAYLHAHLHGKWHTHLHGMAISIIRQYHSIFDIQAIHAQTH